MGGSGGDPVRQVLRRGVERVQGEDPYDDLDACCREHDSCLEKRYIVTHPLDSETKKMASGSMAAMNKDVFPAPNGGRLGCITTHGD